MSQYRVNKFSTTDMMIVTIANKKKKEPTTEISKEKEPEETPVIEKEKEPELKISKKKEPALEVRKEGMPTGLETVNVLIPVSTSIGALYILMKSKKA